MPTSRHWSHASAPCRLEWRPSRWLAASLLTIGVLAAVSILGSEAPRLAAWPAALLVAGYGLGLARAELRRPRRALILAAGDATAMLDGTVVTEFKVQWRGTLAVLGWRDAQGRRQRTQIWPDTLPRRMRRELRLAMINRAAAPAAGSMAP